MQFLPPPEDLKGIGVFRLAVALVVVSFIAACATSPSERSATDAMPVAAAPAPGHQRLHIETMNRVGKKADFPGMKDQSWLEKRAGVKCTARNNKGSWETTTPGTVDVATGAGPLTVECTLEGYRTARMELSCITPQTRSTFSGAMAGLQLMAGLGPAAIYAAPAAVLAAMAGATAAGSATAGPDANVCNYSPHGYMKTGPSDRVVITIELSLEERR